MLTVIQKFPDRRVTDIPGTIGRELAEAGFVQRVPAGGSVAIGVGSRGIANIATIARCVVEFWKRAGVKPFSEMSKSVCGSPGWKCFPPLIS